MSLVVDGIARPDRVIPLVDDHREHQVDVSVPVRLGQKSGIEQPLPHAQSTGLHT